MGAFHTLNELTLGLSSFRRLEMEFNSDPELGDRRVRRSQLKLVEGVPLPDWAADNWEQVATFQAKPDDLLIATFPKAGE